MVCLKCGCELNGDWTYCHFCGHPLSADGLGECPICGKPVRSEWRFCVRCRAPLMEGLESDGFLRYRFFCPRCREFRFLATFPVLWGEKVACAPRFCHWCGHLLMVRPRLVV